MSTASKTTLGSLEPIQPTVFKRRLLGASLPLFAVMLIGVFLRLYGIFSMGTGNEYYVATVKSMLLSWHNFFFIAAEPGASVMVDKPPLGFWLQAISESVFGVSGFSLALPQVIAGCLSILILYVLVRRSFGTSAGLLAAFALAVTPSP